MGTAGAPAIPTALFPASRRAVLGLLYGQPDRAFYFREVADLTGLGMGQLQRELSRLGEARIITRREQGRHVYFQANADCPVFEELRRLVLKTLGAAELLSRALQPIRDRVALAFIYGSVARGAETAESDIDLMVVGSCSLMEVVGATSETAETLRRECVERSHPPSTQSRTSARKPTITFWLPF